MGEKLALQGAGETGFARAYLQGVQALPGCGRFRTGISLWASPHEPLELLKSGSPEDKLILFTSFPYFGESRGEITFGSECESVALLDFNNLGARVHGRRPVASEKGGDGFEKILVHQARYIIFDNCKLSFYFPSVSQNTSANQFPKIKWRHSDLRRIVPKTRSHFTAFKSVWAHFLQ